MSAILSIDETTGLQRNDDNLGLFPLPSALDSDLTALFGGAHPSIEQARVANALTFGANTIDVGFTKTDGTALSGLDSDLKSIDGSELFLYTYGSDNNLVVARKGTFNAGTGLYDPDPNGTIVLAVYLETNGSPGDTNATSANLWVVEFSSLQHNLNGADPDDFVTLTNKLGVTVTNPISFDATGAPSGSNLFISYGDGSPVPTEVGVVVTAFGAANQSAGQNISSGSVVKTSQAGSSLGGATFGVDSQMFDPPSASKPTAESAYFTFVKGLQTGLTVPNLDPTEANLESNIQFSNYFGATKVSFVVSQLQPGSGKSTLKIDALIASPQAANGAGIADDTVWSGNDYIDHQDQNGLADIDTVTITRVVTVHKQSQTFTWTFTEGSPPPAGAGVTVDFTPDSGNGVIIAGLLAGDKITYTSNTEHDRLQITNVGNADANLNASFDIGALKIESGGKTTSTLPDINIYDDGPAITAAPDTQTVTHDETPGVQGDTDSNGTDLVAAGGATIASLFSSVVGGDDPQVADNPIGYARSSSALIGISSKSDGADGAASQELTYGLQVVDGRDSGVKTTEGTEIFMYNGTGALAGLVLGRVGNEGGANPDTAKSDGDIAFALAVNPLNGEVFVAQYLSLNHPTGGSSYDESIALNANAVQETVTIKDKDNDTSTDSNNDVGAQIKFEDDGPTITASSNTQSVTHDETPGVQADTDVPGTDVVAAGGASIASLFTNVPSPGDDPDVANPIPIGFGRSTNALVTVTGGNAGADGPAAQELTYGLHVVDGTPSGVSTSEGTQIFMYNGTGTATGLVLGRIGNENAGGDTANSGGTVAFALAVNPLNGEVFLAQYMSLTHPTGGSSYDESIALDNGAVQMTVSRTDKDGDVATDSDNNIGLQIKFEDDGPTITASSNTQSVTHDETPGVQADTDVPGTDLVAAGGASIASLFTNVPSPGDDPDVANPIPIGFGRSTNALVTVTGGNAGADGPAAQQLTYGLHVVDGTPSGVSTSEGTQIFMYNGTGTAAGLVLGRVGSEAGAVDNPNSGGTVAFALAVNPLNGEVFVAQYLSLTHPTGGSSYDESIALDNGAVQMTVSRTDKDGDVATDSDNNIGLQIKFEDDGPNANGTPVAATVDEDGSPLNTGIASGPGDSSAGSSATGSIAGIFGGGADGVKMYQLNSVTSGLPQNLTSQGKAVKYDVNAATQTLTGYVENGVNNVFDSGTDRVVFTLALSTTTTTNDTYTFNLLDQLDHPATDDSSTGGTVEIAFEDDLLLNLGTILQVVDKDNDVATAAAEKLAITVDDDSPVINTLDSADDVSFSNSAKTGSGLFSYSIGTDDRVGTTYSSTNSDLVMPLASFTGTVGSSAITNKSLAWASESSTQVTFNFGFDYNSNPADPNAITHDTGTIVFNKSAGTYVVTLANSISSFSVLSLNTALGFTGYVEGSNTVDSSQPDVSVAQLATHFFVQFRADSEPSGNGDDAPGKNYNIDAVAPGTAWSSSVQPANDDAFVAGEIFQSENTWPSVSNSTAGISSDTIQYGEVLDFNFYDGDPKGFTSPPAGVHQTTSSTIFLEFDGLDNGEDLVVLLKLVDKNNPATTTTRAVIVEYGDIYHAAQAASIPSSFGFTGTIDNNDGLVVIESNDYNINAGDNWTIYGAQVICSTEGISGSGVNLNGAIGVGSPSALQSFSSVKDSGGSNGGTWDGDVFKIVNIGFVTEVTPNAQLNFGVAVHDYDLDLTAAHTLQVDILA